MSAQTVTQIVRNNSDAEFRAWGKSISDQMVLGGWVIESETGTINWASVAMPASAGIMAGWEIYRSNDAGSGLVDFYVKIEYGASPSFQAHPAIKITVGWDTDGAGNITGRKTNIQDTGTQWPYFNSVTGTAYPCNLAAGAGWACMVLGNVTVQTMPFSIERTRDASGNQQNEILLMYNSMAGTFFSQVLSQDTAYTAVSNAGGAVPDPSSNLQDGDYGMGMVCGVKGKFTRPSVNLIGWLVGSVGVAVQATIVVPVYGVNHTYIVNANHAQTPVAGGPGYWASRFE